MNLNLKKDLFRLILLAIRDSQIVLLVLSPLMGEKLFNKYFWNRLWCIVTDRMGHLKS